MKWLMIVLLAFASFIVMPVETSEAGVLQRMKDRREARQQWRQSKPRRVKARARREHRQVKRKEKCHEQAVSSECQDCQSVETPEQAPNLPEANTAPQSIETPASQPREIFPPRRIRCS